MGVVSGFRVGDRLVLVRVVVESGACGRDVLDRAEVAARDVDRAPGVGHETGRAHCGAVRVVAEQEVVVALLVGQAQVVQGLVEEIRVGMAQVQVELVRAGRVGRAGEGDRLGVGRVVDQVDVDVELVA
ncbi:hypothetical protein ACQ86D_38475 [Streptomyces galilaeus]